MFYDDNNVIMVNGYDDDDKPITAASQISHIIQSDTLSYRPMLFPNSDR